MSHSRPGETSARDDSQLVQLTYEITQLLETGAAFDLDAFAAQHPDYADELRQVYPAIRAMVGLVQDEDASATLGPPGKPPPQVLGDYRLLREIGRGGMGVVYEAEQLSLGRRVALKILPFASVLRPTQLKRFETEAQATAALNHPHIVRIYAVGCERGVHFFAMQLIEGQSLADVIKELAEPVPPGEMSAKHSRRASDDTRRIVQAHITTVGSTHDTEFFRAVARLGIQTAEALEHAHQAGIVHRDIKPSNLMLDADGQLYVTDFGLAHVQRETGLTMSGDVLGTLRYMSPEQAAGRPEAVDHRTDIYALGATLYELLTLRPAFTADDPAQLLRKVAARRLERPRRWNPAIPERLERIVMQALARKPSARYSTAQDLADDLQRFLDAEEIRAKPPPMLPRVHAWLETRWIKYLAAAVLGIAVVALCAHFLLSRRGDNDMFSFPKQQSVADRSSPQVPRARTRQRSRKPNRRLAVEPLEDRRLLAPVEFLISDASASEGGTAGQFVDQFIPGPGITGELEDANDFVIGPDGDIFASSAVTDEILRYDSTTGDLVNVFVPAGDHGLDYPYGLAFASDGTLYVASYNTDEILRYDGTTGAYLDTLIAGGRINMPGALAFAPDGTLYVASFATDEVLRYNASTGEFLNVVMSATDGLDEPQALLVRGGQLYVTSFMNHQVLRYDGNAVSVFVPTGSGGLSFPVGLDYGPDSNLYVASIGSDEILRYNGTTGAFIDIFKDLQPPAGAYSEDGGMNGPWTLRFVSGELYVHAIHPNLIARYDAATGDYLGALATSMRPRAPKGLAFGPDGNLYVNNFCGSNVARYEGQSGTFIDYIVEHNSGGYRNGADMDFGPDGNIYTIDPADSVMFRFNGATGEFMDVFIPSGSGGLAGPNNFVFHTDGKLYVTSGGRNTVDRFDSSTGQFIDTFVTSGSGGLSGPYSLVFGPDGSLYVYSCGTGKVLRYNGTTGAFMGVFADVGPYHEQNSMAFGPDGNLYVSQYEGDSVKRFDGTTGAYIDDFVAPNEGGVFWPTSLAFDALGTLYVANQGPTDSGYVMRFTTADHAVFKVTLSEPSNVPVTVDYSTTNGTAEGGGDFIELSGTLTFMPGETSKSIIVPTVDDGSGESAETFVVNLSNPTGGAVLADAQGVATIVANDPSISVLLEDSFENGQWNGLWVEDSQNDWDALTQRATAGSYSAEVDGPATDAMLTLANPVNLAAYESAQLTFDWLIETSVDKNEYLAVDFTSNGATWAEMARLRGNVDAENAWYHPAIDIDPSFLTADFKIRFRAKVSDSTEDCNVDNVRLVATGAGTNTTPPVAQDDTATTPAGRAVEIPVLANDFDGDNDAIAMIAVAQPAHGAVVNNGDSLTYTPAIGYVGSDSFTYTISDGRGGTDVGNVSVDVWEDLQLPVYVFDIRFETTKIDKTTWRTRAIFEFRLDSNEDGQPGGDDMAAGWAAINVNFNGQYYSGGTDSDGRFVTPYINLGPGTYYADVLRVIHRNWVWYPLDMDLEDDSDGDGKPDGKLVLVR